MPWQVLRAGDGPRAELGNTVTVHYVAKLAADGTVVDDTRSAGAPLTFEAGQGDVLPGTSPRHARPGDGRRR